MTEPQQQPQSSDDSSGESRHVAAQPQYGQRIEPEYGARADEFPPNYNPYVYGGQPEQPAPQAQPSPSQPASVFGARAGSRSGWFRSQCGSGSGWARPRRSPTGASPIFQRHRLQRPAAEPYLRALGFLRHILVHLRPGDLVPGAARADRLPGHLAHPSFPYAGPRTGIAAVVINVLTTIIVIWMTMHGISMDDMYQVMLNMLAPGTGGSGSGDSVSV